MPPFVYSSEGPVSISEMVGAGVTLIGGALTLGFFAFVFVMLLYRVALFAFKGTFRD